MKTPPGNFVIEGLSAKVFGINVFFNDTNVNDSSTALGTALITTIMSDLLNVLGDTFTVFLKPVPAKPHNFTIQVERDTFEWLWAFAETIAPVLIKHNIKIHKIFIADFDGGPSAAYFIKAVAKERVYIERKIFATRYEIKKIDGKQYPEYKTHTSDF